MSPRFVHGPAPRGWRELVIEEPTPWMLPYIESWLAVKRNRKILKARPEGLPLVTTLGRPRTVSTCIRCGSQNRILTALLAMPRVHFMMSLCVDCATKEWFE